MQTDAETFKKQNFPSSCLENLSLSRSSLYFNAMTSALNSLTAFCGNILLGFTQILELLEETRHFGRKMMISPFKLGSSKNINFLVNRRTSGSKI